MMGTKAAKAALLLAAMMFFAVLALDITVPAVVLSVMALSTWVAGLDFQVAWRHRGEAA
jgi:hypothetical protein